MNPSHCLASQNVTLQCIQSLWGTDQTKQCANTPLYEYRIKKSKSSETSHSLNHFISQSATSTPFLANSKEDDSALRSWLCHFGHRTLQSQVTAIPADIGNSKLPSQQEAITLNTVQTQNNLHTTYLVIFPLNKYFACILYIIICYHHV